MPARITLRHRRVAVTPVKSASASHCRDRRDGCIDGVVEALQGAGIPGQSAPQIGFESFADLPQSHATGQGAGGAQAVQGIQGGVCRWRFSQLRAPRATVAQFAQ